MDIVSPLPAVLAVILAVLVCAVLARRLAPPDAQGRFVAIDGLRGYLAFCVFLHHAVIWFFYLKKDQWDVPPSNLYTHFGQSGVALFFMITGFLFFSKILEGKKNGVDWLRLYVSRFLRLTPLYAVAMIGLLTIVLVLSDYSLREPLGAVLHDVFRWMTFTMRGSPNINGVEGTSIILAGVTWSLPYEWRFYFMLPVFAVMLRVRVGRPYVVVAVVTLLLVVLKIKNIYPWLSFFGGIFAAFAVRSEQICVALRSPIASVVTGLLMAFMVFRFPSANGAVQLLVLSAFFTVVAAGNSFFGFFTLRASRLLGEMAYGIYLLHGLLLFVLFRFAIGFEAAKAFTPLLHWFVVVGLIPVLIALCLFCYKKIERPALQNTSAMTLWLRKKFSGFSREKIHPVG